MTLIELSLHLENRPGRLVGVARLLAENHINVASLHVAPKGARGDVRLVVSDPKTALRVLRGAGYEIETQELLAIRLEDRAGSFLRVLNCLAERDINIQHVVILVQREGRRSLVALGVDRLPIARRVLREGGFLSPSAEKLVSNADLVAGAPAIPPESVGFML
jgi:hypothetical protein